MVFRKIAGPMQINSDSNGGSKSYRLPGHSGGRTAKVAQFAVKTIQSSDSTNVRISLILEHGPDGENFDTHSTPLSSVTPGTPPSAKVGQADTAVVLCEWMRPSISIAHATTAASVWAIVEVYEMLKPF